VLYAKALKPFAALAVWHLLVIFCWLLQFLTGIGSRNSVFPVWKVGRFRYGSKTSAGARLNLLK